jgi:phytoene dehydrogenase-like protein
MCPPRKTRAFGQMRAQADPLRGILKPLPDKRNPPRSRRHGAGEKLAFGGAGLALKRLGKEDMRDFLRMMLMNVADVADEHLTDDRLKGCWPFDATLGSPSRAALADLAARALLPADRRNRRRQAGGQFVPPGGMGA